ncbi:MAG: bile acid:sodium symporter family protein [Isosphaeraceae bacterium]
MDDHGRPVARIAGFLGRHFLALLFASYTAAALWPGPGLGMRSLTLGRIGVGSISTEASLPFVMLACLLFNAGLGVRLSQLGGLVRRPRMLGTGLAANVLFPIVFILAVSWWMTWWHNLDETQNLLVGLALIASMPIAGSSTAWSQNADGDMPLSLGLVLGSTFLSPLLTPIALHAVGFVAIGDYGEDLHELASGHTESFLAIGVLAPSVLGILVGRALGPGRLGAIKPHLKVINSLVLLALNYSNAAISLPQAIAHPDVDFLTITLGVVTSLCVLAFVVGWVIARVLGAGRDQRIALMFALGMNNNGTGLVLASMALADHPAVMVPIIFYNMVQHLVAGAAGALIQRPPRESAANEPIAAAPANPSPVDPHPSRALAERLHCNHAVRG